MLSARNLGPSAAAGAVLSAAVPPGVRITSVSPECVLEGQRVTCRFDRVPVDAVARAGFTTGQTPAELSGPRRFQAAVTTEGTPGTAGADPHAENDTATATTGTLGSADLSVTAAEAVDQVVAGEVVTRTLTVRNGGPAAARNVVLTDGAGDGLTPVALPAGCRAVPGGTSCELGTLAAGRTRQVALRARVDPEHPPGPLTRGAAATLSGDPSPSDNATASTTTVVARADLRTELTRVGTGAVLAGGGPVTYRVRARNAGPSTAPGVVIDLDTPPTGLRVVRASVGAGRCAIRVSRALCPTAPLAPDGTVDALVTVAAAPDLPAGSTALSATATSAVVDPTRDDARAALAPPVTRTADLRTRVEVEPGRAAAGAVEPGGAPTTYRVGVANAGPSLAVRSVLSTTLPPGAVALSATSTRGRCTVAVGRVDCAVGDLGRGGTALASIVVGVAPGARGPFALTATASSATTDPTPAPGRSALALGVAPDPAAGDAGPPTDGSGVDAAGVDPGGEASGAEPEQPEQPEQADAVAPAAALERLPTLDAVGLVLAGAAVPVVVGGLVLLARRRRPDR